MRTRRNIFAFSGGVVAIVALALLMGPTGGFPSRPTFQTVRTLSARTNASAPITTQGTSVAVRWIETDAAANNQQWECAVTGEAYLCRINDDTGAAQQNWLTVDRTAGVTDTVNISNGRLQNLSVDVPTHRVVETTTSGAAMRVGDTFTVSKSASTSRNTTTTLAVDPDLSITSVPAGHYIVRAKISMAATAGAGGYRWRLDFPSAVTNSAIQHCNDVQSVIQVFGTVAMTCTGATGTDGAWDVIGNTAKAEISGTFSISWAQNTSNATNTTMLSESWLSITRID